MNLDTTKPWAVFLDIDGTLMKWASAVEVWDSVMSAENAEAIARARQNGHKVLINTGRGYACLPRQLAEQEYFDGYVTALGSLVDVEGKTVYNSSIPREKLEKLLDYIFLHKKPCRFQGRHAALCIDPSGHVPAGWTQVNSKEEFFAALGEDFVSKITVDRDFTDDYLAFVRSMLNVYASNGGGEACNAGNDKAAGMALALKALGIPPERSIAVGDSINDAEVLKAAGVAVAMGNAPDSIKEICKLVTDTCENDGVAKALTALRLTLRAC